MARKIEFEATMDISEARERLKELQRESEKSLAKIDSKTNEREAKIREAEREHLRAEDDKRKQAEFKKLAQSTRGQQRQDYMNESKLWGEDARAAEMAAKEAERKAASLGKEAQAEYQNYLQLQEAIRGAKDELSELYKQQVTGTVSSWTEKFREALVGIGETSVEVGRKIGGTLLSALKTVSRTAMNAAKGGLQALWGGLKNIGGAIGHAVKGLFGFNKAHKNFGDGLKGGFMTVLKYGLGIRSLYFLFRRLRTALTESIKTLAQHDTATKASLDRISAAMNTMKASWGAAFAPILNMVAPILETLINMCTRAANAVAALFAALSGANVFKKATAQADALGKATGGAGAAAKETKKQLMGFDELNVLNDANDSGGGGSGAGDATYEDVEIPDWAKQLKDMIQRGQWIEVADTIAGYLNDMVNKIPWAQIGQKIGYWLNAALTIGARLITQFNWYNLGKNIGTLIANAISGVNWKNLGILLVGKIWALGNILAGMMATIDWKAVGDAFLDILSGAIFGIDWALLLKRLAFGVSRVFYGLGNALGSRDWSEVGERLTALITSFYTEVDWTLLAKNVSFFLSKTIEAATNLLKGLDLNAIVSGIGTVLVNIFSSIEWVELANDVVGLFKTLLDKVAGLLKNDEANEALGAKLYDIISTAINEIEWDELAESLFGLLGAAIGAAASVVKGFVDSAVASIRQFFVDAISEVDLGEENNGTWYQIGLGILNGIGKAFTAIGAWIEENIWSPFIEGIYSAFGLDGDAPSLAEIGKSVVDGLLNGITTAMDTIGEWLKKNIFDPISNGIKKIFGIHSPASTMTPIGKNIALGLLEGIVSGLAGIGEWIKTKIYDPIVKNIKFLFGVGEGGSSTSLLSVGTSIIGGLLKGAEEKLADIVGWITDTIFDPIVNNVKSLFGISGDGDSSVLLNIGTNIINGLKEGISSGVDAIIAKFGEIKDGVMEKLNSLFDGAREIWDKITGIFSGGGGADVEEEIPEYASQEYRDAVADLTEKVEAYKKATAELAVAEYGRDTADTWSWSEANAAAKAAQENVETAKAAMDDAQAKVDELKEKMATDLEAIGEDATEAGGNVTKGYAQGVEDGKADVEGAVVTGISDPTKNTTNKELEMGSPSALMQRKGNDTVQGFINGINEQKSPLKSAMSSALDGIIQAVNSFIPVLNSRMNTALNNVTAAVNRMKSVWQSDWGKPRIRIPVFSISGMFNLMTRQTPRIRISGWTYAAKGGIVDGLTPLIAGEAGKEAIVPLERNTEWINLVAEGLIDRLINSNFVDRLAEAFVHVPMPAVAAGAVVPPNALAMQTSLSDISSALDQLRMAIGANNGGNNDVPRFNLYIDGRQITDVVTKRQRQDGIARGNR